MRLKKLELQGFKSFADRTAFDFDQSVTAFVGPNGCGKSNIVDAFRWILGEQSAKAVRGSQMADVIFNGTASRRSVGYAEASLTIDNNRGILPTDYSEVCITRRLYRSGESEYFLNRQPCRLRDIRQMFLDTGVGMHTYSIIEQGKVDRFIQANANERRGILEEAAGISRYKNQRKEASRRLERARLNLQKVDIKLEEQRKQLRSIKYQAAKARRFRRYSDRLRLLVVAFSSSNYREWAAERDKLGERIEQLRKRNAEMSAQLQSLEEQLSETDARIERMDASIEAKRDEGRRIDSAIEAAEQSEQHNQQRVTEYQQETERCTRAIWGLGEKIREAEADVSKAVKELETIRETIRDQAEAIATESERADKASAECDRLGDAIEDWKNRTVQVIEQATTLRNELNHMDHRQREQLARRARLAGQLEQKQEEGVGLEDEISRLTGQRDEISGRLADRSALLSEREQELTSVKKQSEEKDRTVRDLNQRRAQMLSRQDILQDIEMRSEDVESGVKRLLRREEGEEGSSVSVHGMVADLIRADLKYAVAIEAALGSAAQFLVTLDERQAGAAAALLRTDRAGRAGLIPLSRARAPEQGALRLDGETGVFGLARDFVNYEPAMEPVVRHLLGDTWIVQDLDTALRISNNGGAGLHLVTLDGERVDASGVIMGGEPLPSVGIVSRKSELDALDRELEATEGEINRAEGERGRLTQQLESLQENVALLRKEIEKSNMDRLSNENEILNLRRRQTALAQETALLSSEIEEIDQTLADFEGRRGEIEAELAETRQRHDNLQGELESARRDLSEQQSIAGRLRDEVTRLKVELADKEARRGGLEQGIENTKHTIEELRSDIVSTRSHMEEIRNKQRAAEAAIEESRTKRVALAQEREAVNEAVSSLRKEIDVEQARRQECVQNTREMRTGQESVRQQLQEQQLQEQELRVRMEGLSERVFGEHGIRLEDISQRPLAELLSPDGGEGETETERAESGHGAAASEVKVDWAEVEAEISDLREKIRRMGGVNEESIDEEESLDIAIHTAEAQREDLIKAETHLKEVIRKLNRVCRERFTQTFEEVRKNFNETFRRLFGGGRADLVLDEEEADVLEAGVEVLASPPGKELRSITLMSGGEKTMTTIALLFAIFKSKPSPFCILDEVDAALDESNIDRFTNMLTEFTQTSQFIIITHSKRTINIAESLYGITMQEKGVSKRVAVNLESGRPMNN